MSIKTGQQATTTGAVPLPSVTFSSGPVTIKAPKANTNPVEIGGSTVTVGTGYVLDPGESIQLGITNLDVLYLIGAGTSDHVTWIGF